MALTSEALQQIASAFVSARQAGSALRAYPAGDFPQTLAQAYAIQDHAIALVDDPIGGWKVGRVPPPLDETFGADRLVGPIFRRHILAETASPTMPIFSDGFGAAEAEFLLRIGAAPDPGKTSYTLKEAWELVDAVHVGLEIASSPYREINMHGPAVTISDFGNNYGILIGTQVPGWQDDGFADWDVALRVDGAECGTGKASAFPDGAIGAVRFLLENLAARGIAAEAGTWVSSGAITGVHPVTPGSRVDARFGDQLQISCTIEAV